MNIVYCVVPSVPNLSNVAMNIEAPLAGLKGRRSVSSLYHPPRDSLSDIVG